MGYSSEPSHGSGRLGLLLAAGALYFCFLPVASFAGSSGDPRWDLVTADGVAQITIDVVTGKGAFTNANPPMLRISVGKIVRGKFAKRQIEVIWRPPPNDIDTGGENNPRLIA